MARMGEMAEPVLDPRRLEDLRALNSPEEPGLATEVARLFLVTARDSVGRLREAFLRKDAKAIAAEAHRVKGSTGNVGATTLHRLCDEIEREGRSGRLDPASLERLVAEHARVEEALRREFAIRA